MERAPRTLLFRGIGIVFFILIIIFAYNRFGRYLHGPEIQTISITDYQEITQQPLVINGTVSNTETMFINGRQVSLTDDDTFQDIIVLSTGRSIIEIEVIDSFAAQRSYRYTIVNTAASFEYEPNLMQAQTTIPDETTDESLLESETIN